MLHEKAVKAESSKDLLTIFTDWTEVKFVRKDGSFELLKGHWCMVCKSVSSSYRLNRLAAHLIIRGDMAFVTKQGLRKCFHVGGNSSCRQHIHSHYEPYKSQCDKGGLRVNDWAIPRPLWRKMEEERIQASRGVNKGANLDDHFEQKSAPKTFTREAVLEAVAKHIVCDDQVACSMAAVGLN
jgi:hypothetical protein